MYVTFKDKGIDLAKQAVTEDEAGNYEKALQSYLGCLEYFKTYLKYEKNPKARDAITGKVSARIPRGGARSRGQVRGRSPEPRSRLLRARDPPRRGVRDRCLVAAQFKEYLTRAEYLKGVVGQDSNGADNGAAAAQKVRKPGAGGKEDVSDGCWLPVVGVASCRCSGGAAATRSWCLCARGHHRMTRRRSA